MHAASGTLGADGRAVGLPVGDPRPEVFDGPYGHVVLGIRCSACGHPAATRAPRCLRCGSETTPARFGPEGVVWATTRIHVASGERAAPYTLAYVDLEAGPRLLAHVNDGPVSVSVAKRVRLVGRTRYGDPAVEVI